MKVLFTTILILFLTSNTFGQIVKFDLKNIEFRGLSFILAKEDIIKAFGEPKVHFPQYECGGYTDDLPGGPYYQLVYPTFTYIGSDKETFILEEVQLDSAGKTKLFYAGKTLSGLTTRSEFAAMFGDYVKDQFEKEPDKDGILLHDSESDDGGYFVFKDGKLVLFEYWSDC